MVCTPLVLALAVTQGGVQATELACRPLRAYPHVEFRDVFHEGQPIAVALDTEAFGALVGQTVDLYVVADRSAADWAVNPVLVDVTPGIETLTLTAGGVFGNGAIVDPGSLAVLGSAIFLDLGLGYDVVVDVDRDGLLGSGDLIDGADGAGFYVVRDTAQEGPLSVTELLYTGGGPFQGQNTFYPTNVAGLGILPLVTVSHGGGQNYQWYDHIGRHLASYGYVVMSHENNTLPGVVTAAASTLDNIEYFLGNLFAIAGGVLQGHVDVTNIAWIGHSRGGEGVTILHEYLRTGLWSTTSFNLDHVRLVSSIGPTDFIAPVVLGTPYHMWAGSADTQMTCADCNTCGVYLHHDRADAARQAITIHGAGHGDFHSQGVGGGLGPCPVGQDVTHQVMRGYLLPLAARYLKGSVPAEDFLWRQWESFRPLGAPVDPCLKVDLMYRPAGPGGGHTDKLVIDDFQSQPERRIASSLATVAFTVDAVDEGLLNDGNQVFTHDPADPMNGMVMGKNGDDSRGVVVSFEDDAAYGYLLPAGMRDLSGYTWLSFRACQATRHPLTQAFDGDTVFEVALRDGDGEISRISIGVYGGGVEEPYPRRGCGEGDGWFNQFETIRIRLEDFGRNGSGLDLDDVHALGFLFGPSHGSAVGRLGFDDIELYAK